MTITALRCPYSFLALPKTTTDRILLLPRHRPVEEQHLEERHNLAAPSLPVPRILPGERRPLPPVATKSYVS